MGPEMVEALQTLIQYDAPFHGAIPGRADRKVEGQVLRVLEELGEFIHAIKHNEGDARVIHEWTDLVLTVITLARVWQNHSGTLSYDGLLNLIKSEGLQVDRKLVSRWFDPIVDENIRKGRIGKL